MNGLDALFAGMRTSASGLTAERVRIDVIARNIANAHTTRTPEGGPYRRQMVRFAPILERLADGKELAAGVRVVGIEGDMRTPFEVIHDPGHPDADAEGNVRLPNVNATQEMADMITALRSYEANVSAQENFMRMAERGLRLFE
jgi:flagellar basal-body rod protein FlgC